MTFNVDRGFAECTCCLFDSLLCDDRFDFWYAANCDSFGGRIGLYQKCAYIADLLEPFFADARGEYDFYLTCDAVAAWVCTHDDVPDTPTLAMLLVRL